MAETKPEETKDEEKTEEIKDTTEEVKKPEETKDTTILPEGNEEKKAFRKEPAEEEQTEDLELTVTPDVAFNLRTQEFDKAIAMAEQKVYELKAQKASFIYDGNLQMITEQSKAEIIRKQIEEETLKRSKEKQENK